MKTNSAIAERHVTNILHDLGYGASVSRPLLNCFTNDALGTFTTGLVITTWNRPECLRQSLDSLRLSELTDCLLVIIDDASDDVETHRLILDNHYTVPVIRLFKTKRTGVNISLDIAWSLLQRWGCKRLTNLDSDVLLKPDWLTVLDSLHNELDFPEDRLILSGFNRHNNPSILAEHENYLLKSRMGGINYYFDVSALETVKLFLAFEWWDSELQDHFERNRDQQFTLISTRPSVVQHIGVNGLNAHDTFDYARDFNPHDADGYQRCSCLVSYCHTNQKSLENLYFLLKQLSTRAGLELILIEQGQKAHVDQRLLPNGCYFHFEYNTGERSPLQSLGVAASLARRPVVILHEANVLLDAEALDQAVDMMNIGVVEAIQPYHTMVKLSERETHALLANIESFEISCTGENFNHPDTSQVPLYSGGVVILKRDVFNADDASREFFENVKFHTLNSSFAFRLSHSE